MKIIYDDTETNEKISTALCDNLYKLGYQFCLYGLSANAAKERDMVWRLRRIPENSPGIVVDIALQQKIIGR